MQSLSALKFPRLAGFVTDQELIHGFAEASERAYAAVIYLRTILISKTRVAPLKQVTLPRLELCAAHLLSTLVKRVQTVLSIEYVPCHLWSDLIITLSWIRGHPTQWKTYVANRTAEVQRLLPQAGWHHVASKENPADFGSRGDPPLRFYTIPMKHGMTMLNSYQPGSV